MASKRATSFWNRLMEWYGTRLAEQYGDVIPSEWALVVDRTSPDQLKRAENVLRKEHVKYPPTLGEFEATIPAKATAGPSTADLLAAYVLQVHKPCIHQTMRPWNYFGPMEEFQGTNRKNTVRHPRIIGVVVPECSLCDRPNTRTKIDNQHFITLKPELIESMKR